MTLFIVHLLLSKNPSPRPANIYSRNFAIVNGSTALHSPSQMFAFLFFHVLNTVNDFCIVIFVNHSCHDSRQTEKINLDFYFHTSLWCLK